MDDFLRRHRRVGTECGKALLRRGALLSPIVAQSQSRGPVVNRIPTAPGEIQQQRVTFLEVRGG